MLERNGGLVFKADRHLYRSTLGWRVIKNGGVHTCRPGVKVTTTSCDASSIFLAPNASPACLRGGTFSPVLSRRLVQCFLTLIHTRSPSIKDKLAPSPCRALSLSCSLAPTKVTTTSCDASSIFLAPNASPACLRVAFERLG